MISTWILIVSALIALLALSYLAIRNHRDRTNLEDAIRTIRAIDIHAFRNLVDPAEEEFLRSHLPAKQFRVIKRERAWAALSYMLHVGRAAGMLAKVAHAARRSSDPRVSESAIQMANRAVQLRIYTIKASFQLVSGALVPGIASWSPSPLVDQYGRTAEALLQLGRAQRGQSA